jgi:hypothetical protein
MCLTGLALTLSTAACTLPIDPAVYAIPTVTADRRLSDPQLSRIRGGWAYVARTGRDGIVRLVRDGNTRDMNLLVPVAAQQMDAWWGEVGSAYIAAGLSRP